VRRLLLTGSAFLSIGALHPAAEATPIVFDFTYIGSRVTFTVPTTDAYQILAFGASGGFRSIFGFASGAEIAGTFNLTAGEMLTIAVGGAGSPIGGGGGGSFVVGPGNLPLVIAGGAGSGAFSIAGGLPGQVGLISEAGGPGGPLGGAGGTGGNGGAAGNGGGGGGGFFSAGGGVGGGGAFPGLAGGSFGGGFGGGGGGTGGGGGYSGGGGGSFIPPNFGGPAGGGGSFDAGANQILMPGEILMAQTNGEVIITELAAAIPEPASVSLLSAALAGLAAICGAGRFLPVSAGRKGRRLWGMGRRRGRRKRATA
jgi:hypothetical protein